MGKSHWSVLTALALLVTGANAQTLAQREEQAKMEKQTAADVQVLNRRCDTQIEASWDWSGFTKDDRRDLGIASYCMDAMSGVAMVCESSDMAKQAVQENIKKLVCARATPSVVELKDGTLKYALDVDDANITYRVRDYLKDNL